MKNYHKFILLLFFALFLNTVLAQEPENLLISPKGDSVIIKPIALLDISAKIGDFNTTSKQYKDELKTLEDVYVIDTSAVKARNI